MPDNPVQTGQQFQVCWAWVNHPTRGVMRIRHRMSKEQAEAKAADMNSRDQGICKHWVEEAKDE